MKHFALIWMLLLAVACSTRSAGPEVVLAVAQPLKPNQGWQHIALVAAPDLEYDADIVAIDPDTADATVWYRRRDLVTGELVNDTLSGVPCWRGQWPQAISIGSGTAIAFPSSDPRIAHFGVEVDGADAGAKLVVSSDLNGGVVQMQYGDGDLGPWQSFPFYIPFPLFRSDDTMSDIIAAHCQPHDGGT